jgi:hypothetical protein
MKRLVIGMMSVVAGLSLLALTAGTGNAKAHKPSCTQIRNALKSGKSADEVASQFNVSAQRVDQCSKTSKKSSHKKTAKQN